MLMGPTNLNQKSLKDNRPAAKIDNFSLIIGTSTITLFDTNPIPPCSLNFSKLGSVIFMSKIEAVRPPKREGTPPLYNSNSRMASEAKTENSPKRWVGLKMGAPSM